MTALAGIYRLDGQPADIETLQRMIEPVRYRGTGEPAYWIDASVGLAQVGMPATSPLDARAIVGSSPSGRAFGIFDGRIDDVAELRTRLGIQSGHVIHDVELLLAAYEKWGNDAPKHLAGDYSFAVFDTANQALLCARDPIGTHMLSYAVTSDAVYFATEIKQLLAISAISAELDENMLGLYLCGAAQYGDSTLYKHVKRLPGGDALSARDGAVSTSSFWDIRDQRPIRYKHHKEYVEQFRELLFTSVTDRLRGEGPVSILLSGGLDSGSMASIAGATAAQHGRELKAFYFSQSKPEFDELPFAQEVCSYYGIELTTMPADEHWALKQDPLAATRDEPFIVPFELLNQQALKLAASQGSRIVMTGEGGDEAFSLGYMLHLKDWLKRGNWLAIYRDLKNGTPHYRRLGLKFLRQHIVPSVLRRFRNRYRTTVPPWISDDFKSRTMIQRRLEETLGSSYMDRNYFTGRGSHPFHMLWDHRAANFGMEPVHPLWDRRIVEFLSLVPPAVRLQNGNVKALLKQALQGVLTPNLMGREPFAALGSIYKVGWQEESGRFIENCERSDLERRGIIRATEVAQRYRDYLAGDDAKSARLFWTLITDDWLLNRYPEVADSQV